MGATAAQVSELRRMIAEPTTTTYSDALLSSYIERYPLLDVNGEDSTYLDTSTTPPTPTVNENWIPTYDLNSAAADLWQEKAAKVADQFDFSADGGSYKVNQAYVSAMAQARHYRSKRSIRSMRLIKWPEENNGI